MTDEQAIENLRKILFTTMQANECGLSNNDFKTEIKTYTDILGLIEKQQAEIEVYKDIKELAGTEIKEILSWKYENKKMKSEIENLQKTLATYTAHTVCLDIKQSHKHKEDLEMLYKGCQIELEKKDKIIDEMAKWLYEEDNLFGFGIFKEINTPEKIKEYFKKKVEVKDEYSR